MMGDTIQVNNDNGGIAKASENLDKIIQDELNSADPQNEEKASAAILKNTLNQNSQSE